MTERLYYRDSTLSEFAARVVGVRSLGGRVAVELDRTAFYPTSGGQPHDTGLLDAASVVDVADERGTIWHILEGVPPTVGAEVTGRIHRERRLDHTQQHTGQHVLSRAFELTGRFRTASFHLGADVATVDLDAPRVSPEAIAAAEELANRVVLEDRPVRIHFAAPDDLDRFELRAPPKRSGTVRIVEVEDFDRSACGGTHVERTGKIGPIKVRRWERRGETTRVEFLCGWRALRDYAARLATTRDLAERLSVKDTELFAAATRALDELERRRDENAALRERLLDDEASGLIAAAATRPGSPTRLVRAIYPGRAPDDLKRLALRLAAGPAVVALLAATGERAHVVVAQSPGLPNDLGAILREVGPARGLRGGGTRDLAQGGGPASIPIDRVLDALAARLIAPPPAEG